MPRDVTLITAVLAVLSLVVLLVATLPYKMLLRQDWRLNTAMGAGTYAPTTLPANTNTGSDAIRVALVYKPARLTPLGAAASDNHAVNSRPTLAQTFSLANGAVFTLVVNHFKSKGGCPAPTEADANGNTDSGDGQGCWNLLRRQQAQPQEG